MIKQVTCCVDLKGKNKTNQTLQPSCFSEMWGFDEYTLPGVVCANRAQGAHIRL